MNGLKPRGRKAWDLFLSCLSSLRAGISFDFAGNPGWNLEMGDIKTPSITLDEIFYYLEKADKPCLVAIDEFQAIAKYPEKILKLYCVPIFSIAQMQDLFMQVPNGTIDYAVCDNDLAKLNKTYYPNLNISMPISFDQRASWAVRKTSPLLAAAATQWHRENMTSPSYRASSKRYFEISKRIPHGSILSIQKGKISHYDELFKKYAKEIDWDWRLLASLAYTESNFDTTAVSWAGAKGLMQLMPRTARAMGVPAGMEQNPEESIKAAVKYIAATANSFRRIPDPDERIKFILAAYNAGIGHITDAMALAEKYGKNKYIWDNNVADYILLKSNEEYFNDPLCKNGYFRGVETFKFVKEVISRGEVYKSKIKH